MATQRAFSKILKTQISLILEMKDEYFTLFEAHVSDLHNTISIFEGAQQKHSDFKQINSRLQKTLHFLLQKSNELENELETSCSSNSKPPNVPIPTSSSDYLDGIGSDDCLEPLESACSSNSLVYSYGQTMERETMRENEARQDVILEKNETDKSALSSRVTNLEKRMNNMETICAHNDANLATETDERYTSLKNSLKEIDCKVNDLETKFHQILDEMAMKIEQRKKLSKTEERLSSIETGVMEQLSMHRVMEERIQSVETAELEHQSQLGILKYKVDLIEVKELHTLKGEMAEVILKIKDANATLDDLSSTVEVTGARMQKKVKKLEVGQQMAKRDGKKDMSGLNKKVDDLDSFYKQLCHMMASKLYPLLELRQKLNALHMRVEKRDQLEKRIDDLEQRIHKIPPTVFSVGDLKTTSGSPQVAFNVYIPASHSKRAKGIISEFVDILCNLGSCYDPGSGTFTASRDGLYAVALSIKQNGEGVICARVKHKRAQVTPTTLNKDVCRVMTNLKDSSSSGVGVVALTAGDKLYAEATLITGEACLTSFSGFAGFLIDR